MLPAFERPIRFLAGADVVPEHVQRIIELEEAEFTAVLGQPLNFDTNPSGSSTDTWSLQVNPSIPHARLESDVVQRTLLMSVPDPRQIVEGLNLLHSLAYEDALVVEDAEVTSYPAAFDRIYAEITNIYPYFELRCLDWDSITERHASVRELVGQDFWAGAERWIAELGDAHTQLVTPRRRHHPPYTAEMGSTTATLLNIPAGTDAWKAGIRPGDQVIVGAGTHWLDRVGATPQHHAKVAARRFMTMTTPTRDFASITAEGREVAWTEHAAPRSNFDVDGNLITIRQFTPDIPDKLRRAITQLKGHAESVTLDLRGNTGGNLIAASDARRLFLTHNGVFGTVQFTTGRGSLATPVPLKASAHEDAWQGHTTVLVDSMTYSAAEDFLHPLVGLPTVRIQGGPTGGGSGRPHTRALLDGVRLAVSTAITYTRDGHAIELNGIS